jgi:hypothetical protein
MEPINLFEIARVNCPHLDGRFQTVNHQPLVSEFADHVKNLGLVSINMRIKDLANFLITNKYLNSYEWAEEQSIILGRPPEDILKEKLRDFYERRVSFDRTFEYGQNFRYGALNTGGAGCTYYGNFSILMRESFPINLEEIAYLSGDSLKYFMRLDGHPDIENIRQESSAHSHRHYLATLKHILAIPSSNELEWPIMICSGTDYIEAIFVQEVIPDSIKEIRLPVDEHSRLNNLVFEGFDRPLDIHERAEVDAFQTILEKIDEKSLSLIEV